MQRGTRLLVAALVAVAGGALAFAGASPKALATVGEALTKAPGAAIDVRGTIEAGSVNRTASPATFVLADGVHRLVVETDRPLPEHEAGGSLEGRLALVTGVLVDEGGKLVLRATDVKIGCASKYEVRA